MGAEFGQSSEWDFETSLDWHLLQYKVHSGVQQMVKDLNAIYKSYPALYEKQFSPEGFQWIDYGDHEHSVLTYTRKGHDRKNDLFIACNFTPVPRENYHIGVPKSGKFKEIFNSDDEKYGGSGMLNTTIKASNTPWNGQEKSVRINIPPLGIVIFQ